MPIKARKTDRQFALLRRAENPSLSITKVAEATGQHLLRHHQVGHLIRLSTIVLFAACGPKAIHSSININDGSGAPYLRAHEITDVLRSGLSLLRDTLDGAEILHDGFNLEHGRKARPGFQAGLSQFSLFMATGDSSWLFHAIGAAKELEALLPPSGIIPVVADRSDTLMTASEPVFVGIQANILSMVAASSLVDPELRGLTVRLADGLLLCRDPTTGLFHETVLSPEGVPVSDPVTGMEAQLGSVSCFAIQALVMASMATMDTSYAAYAREALYAVWRRRSPATGMVSEAWDIRADRPGSRLYPEAKFRFDDMGGAFLRAAMMVQHYYQDEGTAAMMKRYAQDLIARTWDERIGGGGFRYLSSVDGSRDEAQVETMYGLFIGTLIRVGWQLHDPALNALIKERSRAHVNNVMLSGYGLKHFMVPHNLSEGGAYTNTSNDSQLGYAALQFPYGLAQLSSVTHDRRYLMLSEQLYDTLLYRHRIREAPGVPPGYIDKVETQPPFGPEKDYYSYGWCKEFLFAPAYLLFASMEPSPGAHVDWYQGGPPIVLGLINGMPLWSMDRFRFSAAERTLRVNVNADSSTCTLGLNGLGFVGIREVHKDGGPYARFEGNTLRLDAGMHQYDLVFEGQPSGSASSTGTGPE
jgi:hypothetical protein